MSGILAGHIQFGVKVNFSANCVLQLLCQKGSVTNIVMAHKGIIKDSLS